MARAIIAKQPIQCDGQLRYIGDTFEPAPDVARRLVSQGYAEYAPKPAPKPRNPETKPETPAEDDKQAKQEG